MIAYLADALERATHRQRLDFVVECVLCTGPESQYPALWKALADIVSDWEPGHEPSGMDSRLLVALADIDPQAVAWLARVFMQSSDPVRQGVGREIEVTRTRLQEIDHDVREAMRVHWPVADS